MKHSMKHFTLILQVLLFFAPVEGVWTGGTSVQLHNLRKQGSAHMPTLEAESPRTIDHPPAAPGHCNSAGDCLRSCWCDDGKCFGGEADRRCVAKGDGYDLKDGGFCLEGRRDFNCWAKDPKNDAGYEDHHLDKAVDEGMEQSEKTMTKASEMDPTQMLLDDVELVKRYMLPGKRPNFHKKIPEILLTLLVVVWFGVFKFFFYQDDRCDKMDRWNHIQVSARREDVHRELMKPDVVLIFHKPDFEHADKDKQVAAWVLDTALVNRDGSFPRAEALLDEAAEAAKKTTLRCRLERASSGVLGSSSHEQAERYIDMENDGEDHTVKLGAFRQALLQDVCAGLPDAGFDVACFTSVDGDEVFVCIGLRNDNTIKQHLQRYGMKLQLQKEVVQKLGIKQPWDEIESSPPFIRYDRRLAENVFGEGKKDIDIFQNYGSHSGQPVCIKGTDRIRIIHQHLTSHLNLDYAVSRGLVAKWYPAHAEARIAELTKSWARWSLLTDYSIRQPLSLINDYFGSRVAFIFAWTGLYTKMLLCLLPAALTWSILNFVAHMIGKTDYWHRGSVMGFSVCIVIWAKISRNMWHQEEQFLKSLWDLNHHDTGTSKRPDFAGVRKPDPANWNKMTLQYPEWKYTCRMCFSWVITLIFCAFVFFCVQMWLDLFSGRMNIAASIVQALMILVFTAIYNWMAEALTIAENHKYQDQFYTSYLKKMFIFQLVNQYSAFFYMAIKQQFTPEGCPDGDCVQLIARSLPVTLTILAIMQIVQVFVATTMVKFYLWLENWQMVRAGRDAPVYGYVEEQGKYGDFRVREQIESMTQLTLTLGYILVFGCVAPRIVPLCFLVFMIRLRADAVLMTTAVNRTVPRMTLGLGQWNDVVQFLLLVGVLFSAYLLVQFGPLFRGALLLTKLSCVFGYCFLCAGIWVLTDIFYPGYEHKTGLLNARRHAIENVVVQTNEDKNFQTASKQDTPGQGPKGMLRGDTFYSEKVVEGDWEEVPKLMAIATAKPSAKSASASKARRAAQP